MTDRKTVKRHSLNLQKSVDQGNHTGGEHREDLLVSFTHDGPVLKDEPSKSGLSARKKRKVGKTLGSVGPDYSEAKVQQLSSAKLELEKNHAMILVGTHNADDTTKFDANQNGSDSKNNYNEPGELNEEQQARVLAAANAMVEEDTLLMISSGQDLACVDDPLGTQPSTAASGTEEQGSQLSSYQKYVHKKPSQVGPPELPHHNYDNIHDIDDLIIATSQKANEWFTKNVPEGLRGKPRPFTDEEDAIIDYYLAGFCHFKKWNRDDLCNRIWTNDRTKDKFWKKVCKAIPYRTQSSIYKHIRRRYHIFDVRAKWNSEDDDKLKTLAITREGQWKTIGEILGRMPEDCRDRWRNYIKCGPRRALQKWTPEEETNLVSVVNEMLHSLRSKEGKDVDASKINWTVVSEQLNGSRSRIQCRYKWTKLNANQNRIELPRMSNETKLWLLRKLEKKHTKSLEKVKWHKLMKSYVKNKPDNAGWTQKDFEQYLSDLVLQSSQKLNFQNAIKDEITRLNS